MLSCAGRLDRPYKWVSSHNMSVGSKQNLAVAGWGGREGGRHPGSLETLTHGTSCKQSRSEIVVRGIYRDFLLRPYRAPHVTGRRQWSCTTRTFGGTEHLIRSSGLRYRQPNFWSID